MKSTKELARELGLLRKRKPTAGLGTNEGKRARRTNQQFSYLIIIDFESTCWKDVKNGPQEIIEFPAVLLNTRTGEIEDEFHHYVQPQESPTLSAFCTELTGITQEKVEQGIPINICLKRFSSWLQKLKIAKNLIFHNPDQKHGCCCTFVTWSDWDLSVCLHYECKRKQLRKPMELYSWIDLRATYRKFYERRPNGLNGALQDVGIEFEGREHSGLHDSRNTARLAWRMMCDGCVMKITKTMDSKQVYNKTRASNQEISHLNANMGRAILAPPLNIQRESLAEIKVSTNGNEKLLKNDKCAAEKSHSASTITTKGGVAQEVLRPLLQESHCDKRSTVINNIPVRGKSTGNQSPRQKSENLNNHAKISSIAPTVTPQRNIQKPSTSKSLCANLISPLSDDDIVFKTPTPPPSHFYMKGNKTKPLSDLKNTFKTPCLGAVNSLLKKTPPMCNCGRRAVRKIAQSPGPNMGRVFYCCPAGRSPKTSHGKKDKGCTYFKWEASHQSLATNNSSIISPLNSVSIVNSMQQRSFYGGQNSAKNSTIGKVFTGIQAKIPQPDFSTPQTGVKTNPGVLNRKTLGVRTTNRTLQHK